MTAKRKPTEMERRAAATQKTVNRFLGKPLKWGTRDCGQLAIAHCALLGTRIKIAPGGPYHSPRGAARVLRKLGWRNVADMMDAHFPRIAWAYVRTGDVLQLPAAEDEDGIGALAVWVGNGRAIMFHQDTPGAVIAEVVEAAHAWRVTGAP